MIVVDLGCFPHRDEISIEPLVRRYRPDVLYGFDPWPALVEGETEWKGLRVILARKAAWIADGEIEFARVQGFRAWDSTVMREKNSRSEWSGSGDVMRVRVSTSRPGSAHCPSRRSSSWTSKARSFRFSSEWWRPEPTHSSRASLRRMARRQDGGLPRPKGDPAQLRCPVASWEDAKTNIRSTIRGFWRGKRALGAR